MVTNALQHEDHFLAVQLDEQDAKALAKEAKRAKREEDKEQAREEKRKLKGECDFCI